MNDAALMTALASALLDSDDAAFEAAVEQARGLFRIPVALPIVADDTDADGYGGVLQQQPTMWRPTGPCGTSSTLNSLADAAYRAEAGQ